MSAPRIVSLVGNPRPASRTHGLARSLATELARALPGATTTEVDLADLAPVLLARADVDVAAALEAVVAADVLIVASPTYKATYSGLLKVFLDRLGNRALAGVAAVPVLLGGAPNHALAVDVHLTPLLLELGASVPARGLFVLEADVESFWLTANVWAEQHAAGLALSARRRAGEERAA